MSWFANHYFCKACNEEWEDEWDCACNDRCPTCNAEIEPYDSEDQDSLDDDEGDVADF